MDPFILVPIGFLLISAVVFYFLARRGKWIWLAGLGIALGALSTFLILAANGTSGWDGIGYAILLIGVCAPVGLGLLLGGLTGVILRQAPR